MLVWRLVGLALVVVWSQSVRPTWAEGLARTPMGFDVLALAGAALALAGPSLVVLAFSSVAGLWFLYEIVVAESTQFIADEYIVHAGLPVLGFVLALAAVIQLRDASREEVDSRVDLAHLRLFRVSAATTLLLAGLHKINSGFFDPSVSCAQLGARISQWWAVPDLHGGPAAVVAFELACPLLLCCYPRLGVMLVVLIMAAMAHIGPAGFATTVVVLGLAFFSPADRRLVEGFMARRGLQLALALALLLLLGFMRYSGPNPWFRFGVFQAVGGVIFVLAAHVGLARARERYRRGGASALLRPAFFEWRRHAPRRAWPGLTSWLLILAMLNGLSPYLGFKFRLSVAMLSNLRTDDSQWNHYLFPRWMDLREHDAYIHASWEPAPGVPSPKGLDPSGVYQRDSFLAALEQLMRKQARGTLQLRHAGEAASFELPGAYLQLRSWAHSAPQSRMAQDELTPAGRPQHCIH